MGKILVIAEKPSLGRCFGSGICTRREFQRMAMAETDSGLKALY